jgi:hypothetical protein
MRPSAVPSRTWRRHHHRYLGQERRVVLGRGERHRIAGWQLNRGHHRGGAGDVDSHGSRLRDASGGQCTFNVWAKVASGTKQVSIAIVDNAYAGYLAGPTSITITTAWQRFKIAGTLAGGQTGLWIVVRQLLEVTAGGELILAGGNGYRFAELMGGMVRRAEGEEPSRSDGRLHPVAFQPVIPEVKAHPDETDPGQHPTSEPARAFGRAARGRGIDWHNLGGAG